ncbi:hypothetical protein GNN46_23310 [Salmonella enterica]|nr:hypothetical protein [Salmonella enterica]
MNKKVKVGLLGIAVVTGSVGWSAAATAATESEITTMEGLAMTVADVAFDIGTVMTAPTVTWIPETSLQRGSRKFGTLKVTNEMESDANITIVPLVKSVVGDASAASEFTKVVNVGGGKTMPVEQRDGSDKLNVILYTTATITPSRHDSGVTDQGADVGAPALRYGPKESVAYKAELGTSDSSTASAGRWQGGWVVYATHP